MAQISFVELAHSYLAKPKGPQDYALKRMNTIFEDGAAYALLGPSGCGKSTLLNIISGLLHPFEGKVLLDDKDVTALPTEARNIAQVFQFPVIYEMMTVYDNLAFPLRNRGMARGQADARVKEIAAMLGMENQLKQRARGLSADAKQKISLGRGMVRSDVNAILFDEPLTVIDPQMKWELRTQLKALHREFGHTMIYVTHDQIEALTFADKVAVMHEGEVVQIGTPAELYERPAHEFVGYFIGSPGMNLLPARIAGDKAHIGEAVIPLSEDYGAIPSANIGFRPEFAYLAEARAAPEGLPAQIRKIEDVGGRQIIRLDTPAGETAIVMLEGERVAQGADRLVIDPARIGVYVDGRRIMGARERAEA